MSNRSSGRQEFLYETIKDKIMELIEERSLKPNDPVPSEGELAELFKVSRMTSKLALQALAQEGIVYRLPRRGTFLADRKREQVVRDNVNRRKIGLVLGNIDDYTGKIISSMITFADQKNIDVILKLSFGNMATEEAILRELIQESKVEGILLFPGDRKVCGNEVLKLKLEQFPLIMIDRIFKEIEIDCVYHDHYQGMHDLTKHLIRKGHTEIGYLSAPFEDVTSREERYQGYIQALLEHALPVHVRNINLEFQWKTNGTQKPLNEAVAELEKYLLDNPDMSAVVCLDDYIALYLYYAATNLGKKVPEQLSIAGFSDIQLASLLPVPLTTMRQSTGPLAEEAVNLLLARMKEPCGKEKVVKIKTEMIERCSVGDRQQLE